MGNMSGFVLVRRRGKLQDSKVRVVVHGQMSDSSIWL